MRDGPTTGTTCGLVGGLLLTLACGPTLGPTDDGAEPASTSSGEPMPSTTPGPITTATTSLDTGTVDPDDGTTGMVMPPDVPDVPPPDDCSFELEPPPDECRSIIPDGVEFSISCAPLPPDATECLDCQPNCLNLQPGDPLVCGACFAEDAQVICGPFTAPVPGHRGECCYGVLHHGYGCAE